MTILYTIQFGSLDVLKGPLGKMGEYRIYDLDFDIVDGVVQDITFDLEASNTLPNLQGALLAGTAFGGFSTGIIIRGYDGDGPGLRTNAEGETLFELNLGTTFFSQIETSFSQSSGLTHTVTLETRNIDVLKVFELNAQGEASADRQVELTGTSEAEYALADTTALTTNATTRLPEDADVGSGSGSALRHWFTFTTGTLESGYRTHWLEVEAFDFQMGTPIDLTLTGADAIGTPEFGTLSMTREADDASLMFQHLLETEAQFGKLTLVTLAPRGDRNTWEPVSAYDFVIAEGGALGSGAIAEAILRADTETNRQMEELTLNVAAYSFDSLKTGKFGNLEVDTTTAWNFTTNQPDDSGFLKALGALQFDPETGTARGSSVADPAEVPLQQSVIYRLTIDGVKYDIEAFDFDPEARNLTFEVPKQGARGSSEDNDLYKLALLVQEESFKTAKLQIFEAGTDPDAPIVESGARIELELSNVDISAITTKFTSTQFFANDGGTSRVVTLEFDGINTSGTTTAQTSALWTLDGKTVSNADVTGLTAGLNYAAGTGDLAPGVYGGRFSFGNPEGTPQAPGSQIFMKIDGMDWVEISELSFELANLGSVVGAFPVSITRVADDSSSALLNLLSNNTTTNVKIEVWRDAGAQGWVPQAIYELGGASVSEVQHAGVAIEETGVVQDRINLTAASFTEIVRNDLSSNAATNYEIRPNGDLAGGTVDNIFPLSTARNHLDTATGRLISEASPIEPFLNFSGGDGLAVFLEVTLPDGTVIKSGDGIEQIAFNAFDDAFSVSAFETAFSNTGSTPGAWEGVLVALSATQNWARLDALAGTDTSGPAQVDVRLVGVDQGVNGGPGKEVWSIRAEDATLRRTGEVAPGERSFFVEFAQTGTVTWTGLDSPDGTRSSASETATSGSYNLATGVTTGPAFTGGAINGAVGNAWPNLFGEALGTPDSLRSYVKFSGEIGAGWDFIDGFAFEPDAKQLTLFRPGSEDSVQSAFWALTEAALAGPVEIETWFVEDAFFGLAEYVFEGAQVVSQSWSGGNEILILSFDSYQTAVADYVNSTSGPDLLDFVAGERDHASDGTLDPTLFGASVFNPLGGGTVYRDSFDALSQPILVDSGLFAGSSAGDTLTSALQDTVPAGQFADIQAAVDSAQSGDIITILNPSAVGLDNVVVETDLLSFDLGSDVAITVTLDDSPSTVATVDFFTTSNGSATVTGGDGNNTITTGIGNDVLNGGLGDDALNGGDGDDILIDGIADDSQGTDTLNGGAGNDTIIVAFATGGEVYDGGDGDDTLDVRLDTFGYVADLSTTFQVFGASFSNFENFLGTTAGDTVTGTAGVNLIDGHLGDDVINAGDGDDILTDADAAGVDILRGEGGNDTIRVQADVQAGELFSGGADLDLLDLSGNGQSFAGATAIDLSLPSFSAHGATFEGFESVIGTGGDDEIVAGLTSGATLDGGDGNDTITGSGAAQTLLGGDGDDILSQGAGFAGVQELYGEDGDDTIRVVFTQDFDVFDGGAGTDLLDLSLEEDAYTVDLSGPNGEFTFFGGTFRGFENVLGTDLNDTITGSDGANEIDGGAGSDTIDAGDGNDIVTDTDLVIDSIDLGLGDDILRLGFVGGLYNGGGGTDLLDMSGVTGPLPFTIRLDQPFVAGLSQFTGFENVIGTDAADTIIGSSGANEIDGGAGADTINAGDGDDRILDTDADADTIDAGDGNDYVRLDTLSGTIAGGDGIDTLDVSHVTGSGITITLGDAPFTSGALTTSGFETLIGTAQDDFITGSDGPNDVDAGAGSDTVNTGEGNDILRDNDLSADLLEGGGGDDIFVITVATTGDAYIGGGGFDTLDLSGQGSGFSAAAPLRLDGLGTVVVLGFEQVIGSALSDVIEGSAEAEILFGGGGNDVISGGAGNDVIDGGSGMDALHGGDGIDTLSYASQTGGVEVSLADNGDATALNAFGDTLDSTLTGFENLTGTSSDDHLTGNASANTLTGGEGDDTLSGEGGDDVLIGGAGADTLTGGGGTDTLRYDGSDAAVDINLEINAASGGHASGDVISGFENVVGSQFSDDLVGSSGDNILTGLGGDDTLRGLEGRDIYIGDDGNDRFIVGNLASHAVAGEIYAGGDGTDTIVIASFGADAERQYDLRGSTVSSVEQIEFVSTPVAGNLSVTLDVEQVQTAGLTTLVAASRLAGDSFDTRFLMGADTTFDLSALGFSGGYGDEGTGDRITIFGDLDSETLIGSSIGDTIRAGGGDDTVEGGDGHDILDGGFGNDALYGGIGDDLFISGPGDDLFHGGGGVDTVSYEEVGGRVAVFLTRSDDVLGGQGVDTFVSIENVIGTAFSDRIVGDDADNHLIGLGGNDVLIGGAGNDILDGGNGWDELIGSGGDDLLIGGFGNDRMFGLGGEDTFHGDGGDDYIEGGLGSDIIDGGAGNDVITGSFGEDFLDGSFGDDDLRADGSADRAWTRSSASRT